MPQSAVTLIIGYGSDLRGDDVAGRRVAEAAGEWGLPGVRAISIHQLNPELAEEMAAAERVIFVDARAGAAADDAAEVRQIGPAEPTSSLGHTADPRSLLALAQAVFGRCPAAWLVTIPGVEFELGENVSATAARGIAQALAEIRKLIA